MSSNPFHDKRYFIVYGPNDSGLHDLLQWNDFWNLQGHPKSIFKLEIFYSDFSGPNQSLFNFNTIYKNELPGAAWGWHFRFADFQNFDQIQKNNGYVLDTVSHSHLKHSTSGHITRRYVGKWSYSPEEVGKSFLIQYRNFDELATDASSKWDRSGVTLNDIALIISYETSPEFIGIYRESSGGYKLFGHHSFSDWENTFITENQQNWRIKICKTWNEGGHQRFLSVYKPGHPGEGYGYHPDVLPSEAAMTVSQTARDLHITPVDICTFSVDGSTNYH
jgi:hypothetical protein